MSKPNKILLLQVAALGFNLVKERIKEEKFLGLPCRPVQTVFPALTCPVEATIRTASQPCSHGIVANGFFFKEQWKPLFWEQNSQLMAGPRIWETFRSNGKKVCQLFIQQSLGSDSDFIISPAPIHKHHGGMIMDCFAVPVETNTLLTKSLGTFPLQYYWGPLASMRSSEWITEAVIHMMQVDKLDLIYAYLPHLDYGLQRSGPDSPQAEQALKQLEDILNKIIQAAVKEDYAQIIFGDYSIAPAHDVIFPNRILKEAGLFKVRNVRKMQYSDLYTSAAFAVVDHQIAHVYVFDQKSSGQVKTLFSKTGGIAKVLDHTDQKEYGIDHSRSGELVLIAEPGFWFDYRWWENNREAPDYATHVDIHNKPGYDPCELFFGWPPPATSLNPYRVKGTHGRVDPEEPVLLASTIDLPNHPETLLDLSKGLKELLDS